MFPQRFCDTAKKLGGSNNFNPLFPLLGDFRQEGFRDILPACGAVFARNFINGKNNAVRAVADVQEVMPVAHSIISNRTLKICHNNAQGIFPAHPAKVIDHRNSFPCTLAANKKSKPVFPELTGMAAAFDTVNDKPAEEVMI